MHDATKQLMGAVGALTKEVTCFGSDPASFVAGVAVRQSSTADTLVLAKASGSWVGVSLGRSLSDHKKTAVARSGLLVPVKLTLKRARCVVTITNYANLVSGTDDAFSIHGVDFVAQAGAATPGQSTFQAATNNATTAASLAAQINAHATSNLKVYASVSGAVVTVYSLVAGVGSTGTGNDIGIAYTDNDTNVGMTVAGLNAGKLDGGSDTISDIDYVTKGAKVYFNDVNGLADYATLTGVVSTISDATYVSGVLTGIDEDGNSVPCALVDMQGGL